ncbi:MAG TPA: hypothetical protein VJL60_03100 [Gammaproteobacteria bacterium]|nr:hypothetical protein [Gammaproteobacteria bacterium]
MKNIKTTGWGLISPELRKNVMSGLAKARWAKQTDGAKKAHCEKMRLALKIKREQILNAKTE